MTDAELLRAVLETSRDAIWFLDPAGRYVMVSPASARLVGRRVEEMVGRTNRELFPPSVAERWDGQFATVLATGATLTTEERLTVGGEPRIFVSRQRAVRAADGTVLGVCGIAQDVTVEHRQAESADAAHAAFDRIYEGMPTPAFTWRRLGDDFVLTRANQAARAWTGARIDAYVGQRASVFYADFPEVRETLARASREHRAVQLEDLPYRMRTTGAQHRLILSFVPLPPDSVVIHAQDITSLTAAMGALRRRAAEQEAIASLGHLALSGMTLEVLCRAAAERIQETLGFDAVGVMERQPDGSFLVRAGAGRYAALAGQVVILPGEGSQAGHAMATGATVIATDFETETRFEPSRASLEAGMRSGAAVPILGPDGIWGVIGVHALTPDAFVADDVAFITAVANVVGAAVARQASVEARERSERLLRAVFDTLDEAVIVVATGAERRLVDINPAAERLLGVRRADVIGQTAERFHLDAAHCQEFGARMAAAFARGVPAEIEFPLRGASGAPFLAETTNMLVQGSGGRPEVIVEVIRDFTARRRMEAELRSLSRRLIDVQETQRREVARELHDEVGQLLTAVRLQLLGFRFPEGSADAARVAESLELLRRGTDALRAIQLNLRPPLLDDLGLAPALAWYAKRQAGVLDVELVVDVDEQMGRVATAVENACFRIAQEALTNALRHARARRVEVILRREHASLVLVVRDDGAGFDPAMPRDPERAGLAGMRERAHSAGGSLEVTAWPGDGTAVRAVFPVDA